MPTCREFDVLLAALYRKTYHDGAKWEMTNEIVRAKQNGENNLEIVKIVKRN